ncbi:MAG: sulfonate ABC transporter substrate-binding protein [Verrucomicrobia bacterium]|nr:sulfonate ABC transporter substrate-binding protein [Verrucomicrobiota bacterium]
MLPISSRFVIVISFLILASTLFRNGEAQRTTKADEVVIRIGYQKFNTLNILKAKGTLDRRLASLGAKVEWHQFTTGPQLLEALNAGSLDFGHAADAPTAFGQAGGIPLVYVAAEPPYPKGLAVLVQKDSPIRTVGDLKGKTVAVGKGWNCEYQIVEALEEAGLKYSDIKPAYVTSAADARAAFESGRVDAVGIWDPFYAVLELESSPRVLCDGTGLTPNYTFLVAHKRFAKEHPELIAIILQELKAVDNWANANSTEVASLLAKDLGIGVAPLERATRRREYGVRPIDEKIVKDQQHLADVFFELGEIPKQIRVEDAVVFNAPWWTPELAGHGVR